MEVAAKLKHARISPQKCRLVADQVRGKPVEQALQLLTFSPKKAASIIKKVLESAIANAEHNKGADIDELKVSRIFVDEGPTMRRWKARAKGRVNHILKRTSHVTVMVGIKFWKFNHLSSNKCKIHSLHLHHHYHILESSMLIYHLVLNLMFLNPKYSHN